LIANIGILSHRFHNKKLENFFFSVFFKRAGKKFYVISKKNIFFERNSRDQKKGKEKNI